MDNILIGSIRKAAYFLLGLLLLLLFYLTYIQFYESSFLSSHPLNRRSALLLKQVERGDILDRNGKILAQSRKEKGGFVREYPQGSLFAQVIGYSDEKLGKTGIESTANGELSGMSDPWRRLGAISHVFFPHQGHSVILNLDADLQQVAYQALGNRKGAVVAISPKTGQLLALVSKPSFNPNRIAEEWQSISTDKNAPLLNRALQGLYPPGSTMKTLTAEAAFYEKLANPQKIYRSDGFLKIPPDYVLHEIQDKAYGDLTVNQAFAVSSNVVFGKLTLELGRSRLSKAYERFGFDKALDESLEGEKPRLPNFKDLGDGDLAQTGIGQGSLVASPLRMAMLAAALANNGQMMEPYLIQKVVDYDGRILRQNSPKTWLTATTPEVAAFMKQMMIYEVEKGTGRGAALGGVTVAGKTGTAENPHGDDHAWFIGFAPAENPVIAVAVIIENGGGGGAVAAPVARRVFETALH
ncbi:MAG: penicillin-binding transpeptidase domain-containing protein [Sporomusaceae bacterium]|nr:penicillin-binding transpeptidase domain-containing protein [Sporomusaceae bacterium]